MGSIQTKGKFDFFRASGIVYFQLGWIGITWGGRLYDHTDVKKMKKVLWLKLV